MCGYSVQFLCLNKIFFFHIPLLVAHINQLFYQLHTHTHKLIHFFFLIILLCIPHMAYVYLIYLRCLFNEPIRSNLADVHCCIECITHTIQTILLLLYKLWIYIIIIFGMYTNASLLSPTCFYPNQWRSYYIINHRFIYIYKYRYLYILYFSPQLVSHNFYWKKKCIQRSHTRYPWKTRIVHAMLQQHLRIICVRIITCYCI